MARKWTVGEITEAVYNCDQEAMKELMRRFPMLMLRLIMMREKGALMIMDAIPDYVTPLAMEHKICGVGAKSAEEEGEEEGEDAEPKEETREERKRRVDRERQQRKRAKDKAVEEAKKEVEEANEEEGGETTGKYDEISAVELFKMCKKRGLMALPKKGQRYYIDILEAADQADEKQVQEEDDEDWGDEEPEEEDAKKSSAPKNSASKKSSAKKAEPEPDDEEEDWNV